MPPSGRFFIEEDLNVHYAVDVLGSRQGWNGLASRGFVDIVAVVNPPKGPTYRYGLITSVSGSSYSWLNCIASGWRQHQFQQSLMLCNGQTR